MDVQRICVRAKPSKANVENYEWQMAFICMFIPENDKSRAVKKARKELELRKWEFISYESKSTLIEERVREEGGEVWDAYKYAKQKHEISFYIVHDHFGADSKGLYPIQAVKVTEDFVDDVVISAGGRRLSSKEKVYGKKNADYIIGEFIFELKDLQQEGLERKTCQQKLAKLFIPYYPEKYEITIDISILSKQDYLKYLDIVGNPLQSHIKAASRQIKETREVLAKPELKGGIILLNTGFGSFPRNEFASQVERYAQKDSSQFDVVISINIWSETNGLDTNVYYEFSPEELLYKEVSSIRDCFNKQFEELMTESMRRKTKPEEGCDPLKPLTFTYAGVDFNWCPGKVASSWESEAR